MAEVVQSDVFQSTFEQCGIGLAHVSPTGDFIRVNKALSSFLGYSQEELVKLDFQDITHPDFLDNDLQHVSELIDGFYDSYQMEKLYVHKDGQTIWGKLTVTLVRDEQGEPQYFVSVVEDIDEKKRFEARYQQSQETFRLIVSALSDRMVVWVTTPDLKQLIYLNEGYSQIWGRAGKEMYDDPASFIRHIHVADRDRIKQHYANHIDEPWVHEYRVMRDDGSLRYIRERGQLIRDLEGKTTSVVITADDISKDKHLQEALKSANHKLNVLSRTDGLTGIDNRRECLSQVEDELKRLSRVNGKTTSTLAFIDLDDFKTINDKYGHHVGDLALKALSERLTSTMRSNDTVGRYGGDEFLLLLRDTEEHEAQVVLNRLFETPLEVKSDQNERVAIYCSIGISQWLPQFEDIQSWIEQADQSMYQVKGVKKPATCK